MSIETEGKTETQRIEVVGTDTQYQFDTFGRPRASASILKTGCSSPLLSCKCALTFSEASDWWRRATSRFAGRIPESTGGNPQSSLVNFRIGELLFTQRNYQAAVNYYRDALRGDGEPRWTEAWSTSRWQDIRPNSQRDRAVNEYRLAAQTNDNSRAQSMRHGSTAKAVRAARKQIEPADPDAQNIVPQFPF